MKSKLEIFSTEELKHFFINLDDVFDINIKSYKELEKFYDQKNLSVVVLENESTISEKTIKNIYANKNFIFVCKDFAIFQKFSLSQENTLVSPISITRLVDMISNFINIKTHIFANIEINNHSITNRKTNEAVHLTQAENNILIKLFNEKNVEKKLLERDALQIKQDLNTSSMESHLNRIRKKLKKINSNFTISSKDKYIHLEVFNSNK